MEHQEDEHYQNQNEAGPAKAGKAQDMDILANTETLPKRLVMIGRIAIPTVLTGVIQRLQELVNLAFLGHLGDSTLIGGVGMGAACMNLMGMSIILGCNSALDTLVS